MSEIENLKNQLKAYGLDDAKLNALMAIAFDEFMDIFTSDLEKLDLEDLESMEYEMSSLTLEDLSSGENDKANELLTKVYGLSAKNKVETFLTEYFQDAVEQAKIAKDFAEKLQSNDPNTVLQAMNAKNNDTNNEAIDEAIKIANDL